MSLTVKEATQVRSDFYAQIANSIPLRSEPSVTGRLFQLDSGEFVEVVVVVKGPKFDIEKARAQYEEKVKAAQKRAEKAKAKADAKDAKAV